jgi:hypothetical protein
MSKVSGLVTGIILLVVGIPVLAFPDLLRWLLGIGLIMANLPARLRKWRYLRSNYRSRPICVPTVAIFQGPYYT